MSTTAGAGPRVLEVVDELVDLLTEQVSVAVQDGPDKSDRHVPDELLVVGVTSSDTEPGYSSTLERQESFGGLRYAEAFTIRCCFSVFDGTTSVRGRRLRAREVLAEIHQALTGASLLAGAVQLLQLGSEFGVVPVRDGDGAGVGVIFDVEGQVLS